ncbi:arsenate reductase ArsC [bacterium]|nr:arsenate reductase ArsC [bacterium]
MPEADEKLRILFLCTSNSCRSQMAEGLTKSLRADSIIPFSAGLEPKRIHKLAIRAMFDIAMNISNQFPKRVEDLDETDFDYVITLCDDAKENCPVFPGKTRHLHVPFEDPIVLAENARDEKTAYKYFIRVRDQIRTFIATLPKSLDRLYEEQQRER